MMFKNSEYWMDHSHCVLNDPVVISLHVVGDVATAISYLLIPTAAVWTSWRFRAKATSELRALLLHLAAFVLACSGTHIMETVTWWTPAYGLSALVKILCGIVSLSFVWRMWRYLKHHPLRSNE